MHTIVALDYKKDEQFIINDATYTKINRVNGDSLVSFEIEYTQNNIEVFEKLDKRWYMRIVEDNHEQDYVVQTIYEKSFGNSIYLIVDALDARYDTLKREMVYKEHSGSKTRDAWFQWVMDGSSYKLDIRVGKQNAVRIESFGYDSRLSLLFQLLDKFGLEFYFTEQTIVIVDEIGDDKSDYISYGINLIESTRIREMSGFGTYGELFGAYLDEENKDKGRHHATYTHELAKVYGKLPIKPIVDERFTVKENMIAEIKKRVEASINISIEVNIDELNFFERGSDVYAGDKIMIIDPRVNMQGEIRVVESNVTRNHLGDYIDVTYTLGGYNEQYKSQTADTNMYNDILNHDKLIEDMGDKIGTVMEQAGGYGNIYRSKEEPTGPNLKHGDLWYQPYWNSKLGREETRMYQYEKEGGVGKWVLIGDTALSEEIKETVEELQKESDEHQKEIDKALEEADKALEEVELVRDKAFNSDKLANEAKKDALDAIQKGNKNSLEISKVDNQLKVSAVKIEENTTRITNIKLESDRLSSVILETQDSLESLKISSDRNYILGTSDEYKNVNFDGSSTGPTDPEPPEKLVDVQVIGYDEYYNTLYTDTVKVVDGSDKTFYAKPVDGHEIVGQTSKTVKVSSYTKVVFEYKKTGSGGGTPTKEVDVKVQCFDERGLVINSYIEKHKVNTYVTFVAKDINDYELTSSRTQEIYVNENSIVKFNYKKKEEKPPISTIGDNILTGSEKEVEIRGAYLSTMEYILYNLAKPANQSGIATNDMVQVEFEVVSKNISTTGGQLQFAIDNSANLSNYISIDDLPSRGKYSGVFRISGSNPQNSTTRSVVARTKDFKSGNSIRIENLTIKKMTQARMNLQLFSNSLSGLVKIGQIDIDGRFNNEPSFLVSCYVDTDYDTGLEIILKNSYGSETKRIKSQGSKRSGFIECDVPYVQGVKTVEVYLANRSSYSYNKGRYKWLQGEIGSARTPWKLAVEELASKTKVSSLEQTVDGFQMNVNNSLDGMNGQLTVMSNQINTTVKKVDTVGSKVSNQESRITQLSDQINLKVSKSVFDVLGNTVSNQQSQIKLLSNNIDLKVSKDKVVSSINVSPERIRIDSKLIHLSGQTLIDDAIIKSSMILSLTASKINTGTLNASFVNVINLNANNISTGYLSSDRIRARSITANHLEADAITVGFNINSTNIKLYGNKIEFRDGNTLTGQITKHGSEYWYGSRLVGMTGSIAKRNEPDIRGIGHQLETGGDFISFSYRKYSSDSFYTSLLTIDPKGKFTGDSGIIMHEDVFFKGNIGVSGSATHKLRLGSIRYNNYSYPSITHENSRVGVFFGTSELYFLRDNKVTSLSSMLR